MRIAKRIIVAGTLVLFAGLAGAVGISDIGTTDDPSVTLIDRKDGSYALVFTNAQTTFTFNSEWTVKEFLVVGGGGAGGGNNGGGGGGGGLIWYTNALLEADQVKTHFASGDRITTMVGAGGVGGFKQQGTAGGHSVLTLGDQTYTAFGGAGGATYENKNPVPGDGGNTGCGAGRYPDQGARTGNSSTMPSSPGHYGTRGGAPVKWKASGFDWTMSGGGGGAGEPGGDAVENNGLAYGMGGKGGDGLPCSITGEEIYYAAGGGGGDNYQADEMTGNAPGGRGGGGCGSRQIGRLSPESSTVAPPESHATGFGCGGGGGTGGSGATAAGGNGSAGIVVLAIEPGTGTGSETPVLGGAIFYYFAGGKNDGEKSQPTLDLSDLELSILDRRVAARGDRLPLESVVGGPL